MCFHLLLKLTFLPSNQLRGLSRAWQILGNHLILTPLSCSHSWLRAETLGWKDFSLTACSQFWRPVFWLDVCFATSFVCIRRWKFGEITRMLMRWWNRMEKSSAMWGHKEYVCKYINWKSIPHEGIWQHINLLLSFQNWGNLILLSINFLAHVLLLKPYEQTELEQTSNLPQS